MKIRTSSISYSLIRYFDTGPSENLCIYFWQFVFSAFWAFVVMPAITIGIFVYPFSMLVFWAISGIPPWVGFQLGFVMLCFYALLAAVGSAVWIYRKTVLGLGRIESLQLAKGYIAAKKHKYCPSIDFVGDD